MYNYINLLEDILACGTPKKDRTDIGTLSIFGPQLEFDLYKTFPLITTKKIHFKSVVYELLWFIKGSTNIAYLNEHGVKIWNEWADEKGELGPVYGAQWRSWPDGRGHDIDQLGEVIQDIKETPESRRLIVSAWNVGDIIMMKLPPCHLLFQFYVANGELSCKMYQRSVDVFLGLPFNIASYALLTRMVAQVTNLRAGKLIMTLGDTHLYTNHLEQARLQKSRMPKELPTLELNPKVKSIDDFVYEDIQLRNYNPHPRIAASIAV